MAVALVVVDWLRIAVDRDLHKVGSAEAGELRVEVGEEAALEQGVVREVDTGHQVRCDTKRVRKARLVCMYVCVCVSVCVCLCVYVCHESVCRES